MNIQRLRLMRAAARVQRSHTTPTLYKQSVGEHTFGAMAIADEVCQELNPATRNKIFSALLQHDAPEAITGDTPAPAKWMYPELERALRVAEEGVCLDYDLKHYAALTTFEKMAVKYCDIMEYAIFSMEEHDMGNRQACMMCLNALKAVETRKLFDISKQARELFNFAWGEALSRFGEFGSSTWKASGTWHGIALVIRGNDDSK